MPISLDSPEFDALLTRLSAEVRERSATLRYGRDQHMPDGFGMTKYDCGLIITAVGQALGFRVHGLADWRDHDLYDLHRFPSHLNPVTDAEEEVIPYLDHPRSRSDYTWFDATGRCVAVFETDGRDNRPSVHLPDAPVVQIREHRSTNNLFKLTPEVLQKHFGHVPPLRAWILFSVDNKKKKFKPKKPPTTTIPKWRTLFRRCDALSASHVAADVALLEKVMYLPAQ